MSVAEVIEPQAGWQIVARATRSSLVRFSTAGSVDDGKSTLIGRLLHDTNNIYDDHLAALEAKADKASAGPQGALALLTDGLKAEREQGITIDVAYRYFSTPKRWFILADTPGHEQYTRNMATGASTADLTIVLVDARKGVVTQTKRHAFIASLLGVPRLLVAVNKMDLVNYSESVFEQIRADFIEFAAKLGVKDVRFIPISALNGDNVVTPSKSMAWYHGETVLEYLENVYVAGDVNLVDFRFPVQIVLRPHQNFRGYAGQISSGQIRVGEEVLVLPSMRKSRIKSIEVASHDPKLRNIQSANAPMSVALTLEHEIDISRGDMIVRLQNVPVVRTQFEAMLVWMSEEPMNINKQYLIRHTTRESKVFIDELKYKVDVNTLSRSGSLALKLNEVGRASLTSTKQLFPDAYNRNRSTGNFVLIDPATFHTVAAGMVIDRLPNDFVRNKPKSAAAQEAKQNLHAEAGLISRHEREAALGHAAHTLWMTGLSASGKSTIARGLERKLFDLGRAVFRIDGDNLRFGLNNDLGFSKEDRCENIRRAAEVARLFNQAGISVVCAFISPYKEDRERAREIIGSQSFVEIYVNTPLEVCAQRDPHGLYKKAMAGELQEFTGVSAPYEAPENPSLTLNAADASVEQNIEKIIEYLALLRRRQNK